MCHVILSTFAFVLNRAKYRCPLPTSWVLQTHGCRWTTRTILSFPWVLLLPETQTNASSHLGPNMTRALELNPRTEKSETDQFGGQLQGRSRNLQFWFQLLDHVTSFWPCLSESGRPAVATWEYRPWTGTKSNVHRKILTVNVWSMVKSC